MQSTRRLKNILGASAGNFVEWFAYASFAIYFSRAFFPAGDQTAQLLNAAFVFAGGFIARPIGALLFGMYADRAGRRADDDDVILHAAPYSPAVDLMRRTEG